MALTVKGLRVAVASRGRLAAAHVLHRSWAWMQHGGAITPGSALGRRFAYFGPGARIAFPPATIYGEPWISIGEHTLIGPDVTISAGFGPGLDLRAGLVIAIGRGCSIGRGGHLVGHQSIEIGADVFIAPYVYVTDQNHGYADPRTPIGRQWPDNRPVTIGDGCWVGTGAIILPGARLGRNVVVAGGAVVRGEFPDHCVVAGAPARIVRRYLPGVGWQPPLRPRPPPAADPETAGAEMAGAEMAGAETGHATKIGRAQK